MIALLAVLAVRPFAVPASADAAPYRVLVGGVELPVERMTRLEPVYCARGELSPEGVVPVEVTVPGARRLAATASPFRNHSAPRVDGEVIRLAKPGLGATLLELSDGGRPLPRLVILLEPPWTPPADDRQVFEVAPDPALGERVETARLQYSLDDAALAAPARVRFAPGFYRTGTLTVRGDTLVELSEGALIEGSPDRADYPDHPAGAALLLFSRCRGGGLVGRGVLDGRGDRVRDGDAGRVHLVKAIECHDLRFERAVLRNAGSWCFHLLGCWNVSIDRLAVFGDWGIANSDGIDPDHCRDVSISNCFIHSGDDAISVKTTARAGVTTPSVRVRANDCILSTRKTGIRFGYESRADILDTTFERCDVIASSRGIGLWMRDGHRFERSTFRQITMDLREFADEPMSGEPFRITIENRAGLGRILFTRFEDINIRAPERALIAGLPGGEISDVTFERVDWRLLPHAQKPGPRAAFSIRQANAVRFVDCRLRGLFDLPGDWSHAVESDRAEVDETGLTIVP